MSNSPRRHPRTTRRPFRARGAVRVAALLVLLTSAALATPLSEPVGAADPYDVHTGISYGTEPEQKLDLYLPDENDRNGAAVLLVHGGGWYQGDRSEMDDPAKRLAEGGFVAATVGYRLESQTDSPFPDEVYDVQLAVQWFSDNAHRYGVEKEKIGMIGGSAGGHLVSMVATLGSAGDPTRQPLVTEPSGAEVAAVASWSGLYDLSTLVPRADDENSCDGDPNCLTISQPNLVPDFLGCSLEDCPDRYEEASPINHVGPSTAPMFLANSTDELIPLSQPDAMINRLSAAGVPNSHQFVPGQAHAGQYIDAVWGNTESFLRRHLGVEKSSVADWLVPSLVAVLLVAALAAVAVRERRRHEQLTATGAESPRAPGARR